MSKWLTACPFDCIPERGALVKVKDGRKGHVNYSNWEGFGIRWEDADETQPPDALLREPFPTAKYECVGREFRYAIKEQP